MVLCAPYGRDFRGQRFQLRAQAAQLLQRFVILVQSVSNLPVQFELPPQIFRRSLHPRIDADFERLRVALAASAQHDFVFTRQHRSSLRITRRVVIDSRNRIIALQYIRLRVVHIPDEPVHSRSGRKELRRTHPVGGHI